MTYIRTIVDLSVPLDDETLVYPGDPVPRMSPAATIDGDGFNVLNICMGSQTGTHIDAPYHFLADGPRVDELDLALFYGPAMLLDCSELQPRRAIEWSHIADQIEQQLDAPQSPRIALFRTDWSRHWRTPLYFDHPHLTAEACTHLLDHGIRTFLFDLLSPDETPRVGEVPGAYAVHHLIADAGGVIGENLCNLDQIDFTPVVSCLPLRLTSADGAPVRAVALDVVNSPMGGHENMQ